jgi:hypothetical protein
VVLVFISNGVQFQRVEKEVNRYFSESIDDSELSLYWIL